jgi:hypothetical protein
MVGTGRLGRYLERQYSPFDVDRREVTGRSCEGLADPVEVLGCATPELRLCLASLRGMTDFVFDPPLRLARDVTVRTIDDAAEFARTYVGPRLPRRRDRLVRVIEEISGEASGRAAARMFRAWVLAEGLLAEEC